MPDYPQTKEIVIDQIIHEIEILIIDEKKILNK